MVDVSLMANVFEEYEVDGDNTIGLNLDKIDQFLGLIKSDYIIELGKEDGRLIARKGGLTQGIPLLDIEELSNPNIPDLDLPTEVKSKAGHIKTGIKAANYISDQVKITADDMKFKLSAESDQDEIDVTVYADEFAKYEVNEDIESNFAIGFLKDMLSSVSSKAPITVRLGSDHPIEIEYRFADGYGSALMMLAPRVEG